MSPDIEKVLFTKEQIADCVADMGAQITSDYKDRVENGEELVLVCLLRGGAIFMADLARAIDLPLCMDYMRVSSYGNLAISSGEVVVKSDVTEKLAGRHVIIIEDVIDTGLTLQRVIELLKGRNPLSVEVAAFVRKNVEGQAALPFKYVGFECPNEFIVGYGLDYAEKYRNLPDICVLKPEVYM